MHPFLEKRLQDIRDAGLHRSLRECVFGAGRQVCMDGRMLVDFASNDYLGLAADPLMAAASQEALARYGTGGRASRLICGTHTLCAKLEAATAAFKGSDAALVFASGYALNATVLPALAGEGCAILADRLNHASMVDGARLSRARLFVYSHNDMDALEKALVRTRDYACRLIVTDTVFSMDGDIAPLAAIHRLAKAHDALVMADEAHATGVLGPQGRGAVEAAGLSGKIDFVMGTYSKALGSLGAFVACGAGERDYLLNTARGLIFTTALPPVVLAASLKGLALVSVADAARARLAAIGEQVRGQCRSMGFDTGKSCTQIIPVILGKEEQAVVAARQLQEKGYLVPAVRFPTVKKGEARLRISLSAAHTDRDIEQLLNALEGL
ncbi:MAG: 8-amino-7-oxononanoate synthase [Fibrobacterota bacterium]